MICSKCKKNIEEGHIFCPNCGNAFLKEEKQYEPQSGTTEELEADGTTVLTAEELEGFAPVHSAEDFKKSQNSRGKNSKVGLIVGVVVAVVLVAVGAIFYAHKTTEEAVPNICVTSAEGTCYLVTNPDTGECIALYYATATNEVSLYDYVEDTFENEDNSVVAPSEEDYKSSSFEYKSLEGVTAAENASVIYASCTKTIGVLETSIKKCAKKYKKNKEEYADTVYELCFDFNKKYASLENADGYFAVTSEIKEALVSMANILGNGASWTDFCFEYAEKANLDEAGFEAAQEEYQTVLDRMELRASLQNNSVTVYRICKWENGETKVLADNVVAFVYDEEYNLVYKVLEDVDATISIDNITTIDDVKALFELDLSVQNHKMSLVDEDAESVD